VDLLLSQPGTSANTQDQYGRTPLWWAAVGGSDATVKLLLSKYGCDSKLVDNFGRTPLFMAARKCHHGVV
ncbi:hypothetical protein K458DRAFT_282717, partial [Lentithecium fluviatile CBS 122367]